MYPVRWQGEIYEGYRIEDLLELRKDLKLQITNRKYLFLVDRIVVKEFDEDDIHRLSDSVGTAFYEGEGDVYVEVQSRQSTGTNRLKTASFQ